MKKLLITIDGPAGAGKTSGSKMLAARLGYTYVDTGALYRGVGYFCWASETPMDDDEKLAKLLSQIELAFEPDKKDGSIRLIGRRTLSNGMAFKSDISDEIRTPEMSMRASAVSARPVVRAWLLDQQRAMGQDGGCVFEGRDMGTVVFPNADIKFFITASPKVRAQRRWDEMTDEAKAGMTFEDLLAQTIERDHNDSTRAIAPLKPADDAITIMSDGMTVADSVDAMLAEIKKLGVRSLCNAAR